MKFLLKKYYIFIITIIATLGIVGCSSTPSNNTTANINSPLSSQDKQNQQNIDFDKLNEMTKKNFINSQTYPLVHDTDFSLFDNNSSKKGNLIVLTAIVGDSINKDNLLSLADGLLRSYGSNAAFMYNLSSPSKESYGGIFDLYDARIIIVPASNPKNKSFIDIYIPAGMQTKKVIAPSKDFKN